VTQTHRNGRLPGCAEEAGRVDARLTGLEETLKSMSPKLDALGDAVAGLRAEIKALQVRSSVWSAVGSALPVVIALAMALLTKLWR
jgi:hypothetical protein